MGVEVENQINEKKFTLIFWVSIQEKGTTVCSANFFSFVVVSVETQTRECSALP